MTPENRLALIVALYLPKFDVVGYQALGYASWTEALEKIGAQISAKPNTIKQMREQFDPLYPNPRAGWYQRPMLRSRIEIMQQFGELGLASYSKLVQTILQGAQNPTQLSSGEDVFRVLESPSFRRT